MFSKKPQLAHQTAAAASLAAARPGGSRLPRWVGNPFVGLAVASLILGGSAIALIATGDPGAGAPSVRVALGGPAAGTNSEAGAELPYGEFDTAGIEMTPLEALADADTAYGGEALITLPNGEQQRVPLGRQAQPLSKAPIAGLFQPGPAGPLPVIAADGRTPAQAYARPFVSNGKPKVAIVVTGLGIQAETTRRAIEQLPPEVTLSFAVTEVAGLQGWIDLARAHGHEVLLEIPMEPRSFPQDDPGPGALMANLPAEETVRRLDIFLARATGYFGVTNYMGSKFLTAAGGSDAFATGLRRRGLAFVDDGAAASRITGVPRVTADKVIDDQIGADSIAQRLAQLEQTAKNRGQAMGSGFSYPITISQVAAWTSTLEAKGLQLAPASALAARR